MLGVVLCMVLWGCRKKVDNPGLIPTSTYYPMYEGKQMVYDVVDSTTDGVGAAALVRVFHYELTETMREIVYDGMNRPTRRIEADFSFIDSPTNHTLTDFYNLMDSTRVWYDYQDNNVVERTEENIRYIRLKTPLTVDGTWNGNFYNILDKKMYRITNTDTLVQTFAGNFSTLRVLESNKDNIAGLDYSSVSYAKNVGVVAHESKIIVYNTDQIPKPTYIRRIIQRLKSF